MLTCESLGHHLQRHHSKTHCLHTLDRLGEDVDQRTEGVPIGLGIAVPSQAVGAKRHQDPLADVQLVLAIAMERPCVFKFCELLYPTDALLRDER